MARGERISGTADAPCSPLHCRGGQFSRASHRCVRCIRKSLRAPNVVPHICRIIGERLEEESQVKVIHVQFNALGAIESQFNVVIASHCFVLLFGRFVDGQNGNPGFEPGYTVNLAVISRSLSSTQPEQRRYPVANRG